MVEALRKEKRPWDVSLEPLGNSSDLRTEWIYSKFNTFLNAHRILIIHTRGSGGQSCMAQHQHATEHVGDINIPVSAIRVVDPSRKGAPRTLCVHT